MNRALVIYTLTGEIVAVYYGDVTPPEGNPYMYVDMVDDAILERIDIQTGKPVWKYLPQTTIGQLQLEVNQLKAYVEALATRDDMTDANIAIDDLIIAITPTEANY